MMGLVKAVWAQLPVNFRRALAKRIMAAAPGLPEASPQALAPDAPIVVVGFLTSASGLGQAARLAITALQQQNRDVYGVDLGDKFFETHARVAFAYKNGAHLRGPARVLININAPYMSYVFRLLGQRFLREKHITGYWAWELSEAPPAWREGFARVHAIAAPSRFVADAIAALGDAPPIKVAPHPVALERLPTLAPRREPISQSHPFRIACALNIASGYERKNPLALIAAFKRAFPERDDVKLSILAGNTEHYPPGKAALDAAIVGDRRIEITFAVFDRAQYWRWFGAPDLYASLHRAEGFGLPLAESMLLGVPVMATDWSANAEFMTEGNAIPVPCAVVPIDDPQRKYEPIHGAVWAEPDVDAAARLLQRAAAEPAWLKELAVTAKIAAQAAFTHFDPFVAP